MFIKVHVFAIKNWTRVYNFVRFIQIKDWPTQTAEEKSNANPELSILEQQIKKLNQDLESAKKTISELQAEHK